MKKLLTIIFLVIASIFLIIQTRANAQADVWQTMLVDEREGVAHDLNLASITPISNYEFFFIHRARLKTPARMGNGVAFDTIVMASYGNCKTRQTKIVEDSILLGETVVARNRISPTDDLEKPDDATIHGMVLIGVCGQDPKFTI